MDSVPLLSVITLLPFDVNNIVIFFILLILLSISAFVSSSEVAFFSLSPNDFNKMNDDSDKDKLIKYCQGIQMGSPVDSQAIPEPWDMPGYDAKVIMAAGAFVSGSSIELSADGPIKPPYAVYFQGGLTWPHAKFGIMKSLQRLVERNVITEELLKQSW